VWIIFNNRLQKSSSLAIIAVIEISSTVKREARLYKKQNKKSIVRCTPPMQYNNVLMCDALYQSARRVASLQRNNSRSPPRSIPMQQYRYLCTGIIVLYYKERKNVSDFRHFPLSAVASCLSAARICIEYKTEIASDAFDNNYTAAAAVQRGICAMSVPTYDCRATAAESI